MYSVYILRLQKRCQPWLQSTELETIEVVMILSVTPLMLWFLLNSLLWKKGAHCSVRHDSCAGGNMVSHLLWYAKLTLGFWKEKSLPTHTVHYLMYFYLQISASVAYRQTLLLALGMCSDMLSALTHLACFSKTLSFFLWPRLLLRTREKQETCKYNNSTTLKHAPWISSTDNEVICLRVARSPTKAGIH